MTRYGSQRRVAVVNDRQGLAVVTVQYRYDVMRDDETLS